MINPSPPFPVPHEAALSEEQFYALRARLERMDDVQLAHFRDAPENQALLRQFDAFARRQALPYLTAMLAVLLASVAGAWLVM